MDQGKSPGQKGLQMNDEALQKRDQLANTYLQQLQALAFEISVAMDAIAANALPRFQESVATQEMLCASLAKMTNKVSESLRSPEQTLPSTPEIGIESKIHSATVAVRGLNLKYSALLRHSGRSIALLSLLCKSHMGRFQEDRGTRLKHQTWSCEM